MNSLLCASFIVFAIWSLKVEADLIEEGCKFVRKNPDLVDDMVKCETDSYPARFTTISNTCVEEAGGLNKEEHINAVCANREYLTRVMGKIERCVSRYEVELMGMLSEIMDGYRKSQTCIQNLVLRRLNSGRSRRSVSEVAQASKTAQAVSELDGLRK